MAALMFLSVYVPQEQEGGEAGHVSRWTQTQQQQRPSSVQAEGARDGHPGLEGRRAAGAIRQGGRAACG